MKKGFARFLAVALLFSLYCAPAFSANLALWAGLGAPIRWDPGKVEKQLERLGRLYADGRYFELRDALAAFRDFPLPDLEFFRGAVDQVFNRLDSAISRLGKYLTSSDICPNPTLAKEARFLLADAYRRLGRYREAGEVWGEILALFESVLNGEERANCEKQIALWSALADIPRQMVEVKEDTVIRMIARRFPVRAGTETFLMGYDTGANLSVLFKSAADILDVPIFGPAVMIQTGTGRRVEGRIGVVPELKLGSIVIRNVVFLILPDEFFPPENNHSGAAMAGLLGAPVLEAFCEFTETRNGDLIIPARPHPRSGENMCFSGFMPIVDVGFRGGRLSLCLDTGCSATYLHPPFFRRYRGEIKGRSKIRVAVLGGIGGARSIATRILDVFLFRIGDIDVTMRRVPIHTEATHTDSRYFDGTLGQDLLFQCQRMTINFKSMSFILE